jgi:peptidoglycan hydrolase-like protein with peptidoglycan-binding domain
MAYTYIEGNLAHSSGANGTITRVVLHATVSPCRAGGARDVARYFQSPKAGGLAHYVVDPREVIQCAHEDISTWHAPPNKGSIGVELCDPQAGDPARWRDQAHEAMLHRAAALVADICERNKLPLILLDENALKAGHRGITLHHTVSQAFHKSTHTDPDKAGPFPVEHFLDLVRAAASAKVATARAYHYPRTLREGMQGDDVQHMQVRLGCRPDGDFGPATFDHLVAFQKAHGLKPDGVCGPLTQAKLG